MAESTFSYADYTDLKYVFSSYAQYTGLVEITKSFKIIGSDVGETYTEYEVFGIGQPHQVFGNSEEYASVVTITNHTQYKYDKSTDVLVVSVPFGRVPHENVIFTMGIDRNDYVVNSLIQASDELNSLVDKKYPRPIPKSRLTPQSDLEYDHIIKRATCLICAKNMIKSQDPSDPTFEVFEAEANKIVEGLRDGSITLHWEADPTEIGYFYGKDTNTSTFELSDVVGQYHGQGFDQCKITCVIGGSLGTAVVNVYWGRSGSQGADSALPSYSFKPSGSYDSIGHGLKVRFSYDDHSTEAMVVLDEWYIPVRNIEQHGGVNNSSARS